MVELVTTEERSAFRIGVENDAVTTCLRVLFRAANEPFEGRPRPNPPKPPTPSRPPTKPPVRKA